GRMLREARPDLRTAYFHHTPFAGPQGFAVLPSAVADALLDGMAGFGSCGFHSPRWAAAYEACAGRPVPTYVSPAAPDADDVAEVAASDECQRELGQLEQMVGDCSVLVRVDRIELSKNILRGFHAFDEMLARRPDLRARV